MKPDEINIAIAEFCGIAKNKTIPNYYGDLNVCRNVVLRMPYGLQPYYMTNLFYALIEINKELGVSDFDKHTASAPVMCKAILSTIGKWRDGQ